MLYRLTPPAALAWADYPPGIGIEDAARHGVDLDRLEWRPKEARAFSTDLLRIALRHGVATERALVVHATHTTDLGRADALKVGQLSVDDHKAGIRASEGDRFERGHPGWAGAEETVDSEVRDVTDRAARQAEDDLDAVLAAPVKAELLEHWLRLGGADPENESAQPSGAPTLRTSRDAVDHQETGHPEP